jgi:hypothetical protein
MRPPATRRNDWAPLAMGACALLLLPLIIGAAFFSMLEPPDGEGATRQAGEAARPVTPQPAAGDTGRPPSVSSPTTTSAGEPAAGRDHDLWEEFLKEKARVLKEKAQRRQSAASTPDGNEPATGPADIPAAKESDARRSESQDHSDIARALQGELRRVGCDPGAVNGVWNPASRRALQRFNNYAGTTLDVAAPSVDALNVVRLRTPGVCPVVCARGYRAERGGCIKITCKGGMILGSDGTCKEPRRPADHHGEPETNLPRQDQPVRRDTEECSYYQQYMRICGP